MALDAQEAVGETNTIFLGAIGPTGVRNEIAQKVY